MPEPSLLRRVSRGLTRLLPLGLALVPLSLRAVHAEAPPLPDVAALVKGHNAFACELYARLAALGGGGQNVLVSPYSVHTALAMTRAGARGETAGEMDRVLRLPPSGTPEAWKALVTSISTPPLLREVGGRGGPPSTSNTAYSLSVANALFGQRGYPFVPEFRALVVGSYGAAFEDVDFAAVPATRKRINDWVLSKTNDKIKDLFPEGMPDPSTRLALVNAIHFLAQWAKPFHDGATLDKRFTNAKGEAVNVRMMRRTDHLGYYADEGVQVVALPYRDGAAEMLVALPRRPDLLDHVERALSPETLERWVRERRDTKVALELPRFRFEAATQLTQVLADMGMPRAFSPATADFRGIADRPDEPLYVGVVLHKAFIAVDEEGTEAAAATAVTLEGKSAPLPEQPVAFVCDRPFLFFLRHRATGALLFSGRLALPEAAPSAGSSPR